MEEKEKQAMRELPNNWAEAFMEAINKKEFLELAEKAGNGLNKTLNGFLDAYKAKNEIESKKADNWQNVNKWFLVCRTALSALVLFGLFFVIRDNMLPKEIVGAAMAAVIASLFVPPKK